MSIQIIEVEIPVAGITEITVYFGSPPGGGAPIEKSATPPTDTNAIWFDTTDGTLNVWYVDAWVVSGTGGDGIPDGAYVNGDGAAYINGDGEFYIAA